MDFVQPHLDPVLPVAWSPPGLGLLKLNFDGSCVRELDPTGFGGVIQNSSRQTLISFIGPLPNGFVLNVELFALWRGFSMLEELGVQGSILEKDSKIIVS